MTAILILALTAIDPTLWDFSVDVRWSLLRVVVVAGVLVKLKGNPA
jgi:hypothetical protein